MPARGAGAAPPGRAYIVHPATTSFPIPHTFVNASDTQPKTSRIVVQMADFFRLLQEDHRLKLCPLYAPRTVPNAALMPISDYVTVLRNVSTQSGSRRYKYAEGLVNVRLTAKGAALPGNTHVLTVYRTCKRTCSNVAWMETVSVDNIRARRVQILFTSFCAVHTEACVPLGAKGRPKPLIAQHARDSTSQSKSSCEWL